MSEAVCYIAKHNYSVETILHLLDDFVTIDRPDCLADRTMAIMTMLFKKLHLPLAEHKTAGPGTVIEYLGILLDTINMEARLPSNKLERITQLVTQFSMKKTCTKRELLSLLGHLHYASRIVLPGRSFVSSLIQLSTTVSELHYHVSFNKQCRADLQMWSAFLRSWNGISMFYDDHVIAAPDIHLFSDASLVLVT